MLAEEEARRTLGAVHPQRASGFLRCAGAWERPFVSANVQYWDSARGFGVLVAEGREVFATWEDLWSDERWPQLERGTEVELVVEVS